MKKQFNLDLNALKSCSYSMSNDDARYYLKGVHIFEKDGVIFYESTNCHMLIQVTSEVQNEEFDYKGLDIIIPSFIVKELSKTYIRKGFGIDDMVFLPCDIDETRINIEMIDGLINFKLVDGSYPDTSKAIPKLGVNPKQGVMVNAGYVNCFYKSLKALGVSGVINMQFTGNSEFDPILINDTTVTNWLGVLMPCRV